MRKPFQSFQAKSAPQQTVAPVHAEADDLFEAALAAMRGRIEQRFLDAGLELTHADLLAVSTGVSQAIRAAESSAAETLVAFKKATKK